jgi:hypothetical protein
VAIRPPDGHFFVRCAGTGERVARLSAEVLRPHPLWMKFSVDVRLWDPAEDAGCWRGEERGDGGASGRW